MLRRAVEIIEMRQRSCAKKLRFVRELERSAAANVGRRE
jgi:hypothetical protein